MGRVSGRYVEREQAKFSRWLRERGIRFVVTRRSSELAGAPSHLIIEPPPVGNGALGVAVLFKHPDRLPKESQSEWLVGMARRNWLTVIAFSCEQAIRETVAFGYPEDQCQESDF